MKSIILVALALVAVAVAGPAAPEEVKIVRSEFQQQPEGGYQFGYEADNGIVREEVGEVKEALDEENKPHKVVVVRGSYSYPGEDGKPISISYFADESGYHADGESIPKVPARR
ncbi:cuticular protein RR-1 [Spodoptera litura]|nr:cuticular protein RR-1 [Spodoptera litura]